MGTVSVLPHTPSNGSALVLISNLDGTGTLNVIIDSGTASDLAGNLAPGGNSIPFSVLPVSTIIFRGTVYQGNIH